MTPALRKEHARAKGHDAAFAAALRAAVRGDVSFSDVMRGIHATDASHYQIMPLCVVAPRDEEDCVQALRVASEHGVSITSRGAGTSLSGQTHGPGMILDLSRFMNQVVEIDPDARRARAQPGLVRDHLNRAVQPHGLHFAPDPATASRATLGGMIGNNSSGMRSVRYGRTSDHVTGCRILLSDGSLVSLGEGYSASWGTDRAGDLHRSIQQIVGRHRRDIETRFPKVMRRVSGYALDAFLSDPAVTPWNLTNLICGSEGTLAVVVEATVNLEALPTATALCPVHFQSLPEAINATASMLEFQPTAVELLDQVVMREAQQNASTRVYCDFIDGSPTAMQIVEFADIDGQTALQQARSFASAAERRRLGYAWPVIADPAKQQHVWTVRRLGLGLITNALGPRKGQAFVEDACLPIPHMADYVARVLAVCDEQEVEAAVYGHASVGVLHIRPMLDLHRTADIAKMKTIADAAFDVVVEYGGAFSGEHGDGLVRGEYIERYFGPDVYAAFRETKDLFDPEHRLNPGKIIDPPSMTEHIRYGVPGYEEKTRAANTSSHFHFRAQGGLVLAVEQCNGVGACRQVGSGVMCPSYMATREEKDTTRARANALRLAISGQLGGASAQAAMAGEGLREVMDLCLGCKACRSECPNAVDVARMKAEVLQARHDTHGTPLSARLAGALPTVAHHFTGPMAGLVNAIQNAAPTRYLLAHLAGFDPRRRLPRFARRSLMSQLRRRSPRRESRRGQVVLYADSYTNAYEPHIGLAAVDLLESAGYHVTPLRAGDSQRARISQGLLRDAARDGKRVLEKLQVYAAQGTPILCLEPSCASSLKDDLPDLIDDEALGASVAPHIWLLEEFLYCEGVRVSSHAPRLLAHGHCHQKALFNLSALSALLPDAEIIDAGCCGMAGAFGYTHYDLSMRIGEDRLFPAIRDRAPDTTVVASGFSCRHQIYDACGVMPKHFVEVVEVSR